MNDFHKSPWFLTLAAFVIFYSGTLLGQEKQPGRPTPGTATCHLTGESHGN